MKQTLIIKTNNRDNDGYLSISIKGRNACTVKRLLEQALNDELFIDEFGKVDIDGYTEMETRDADKRIKPISLSNDSEQRTS